MGKFFNNKYVKITVKVLANVLLYAFLAIALFAVILSIFSKKDKDGGATVLGYQLMFVRSDSMAQSENSLDVSDFEIKDIPAKALIFVQVKPEDKQERLEWYGDICEGDVLTFRYKFATGQETVTHRVKTIVEKKDAQGNVVGYVFTLLGDNKASETADLMEQIIDTTEDETSFNYIIGKVTGKNYSLGLLVYALKSPVGIICIVIIPCLIIIGFEIAKIIAVFSEDKKQKQAEENAKNASEIESLKRQLAMLQQSVNADTGGGNTENNPQLTTCTEEKQERNAQANTESECEE